MIYIKYANYGGEIMKQKVNKDNWNRNKQFQFFSKFDSPYTGCTTLIDVDDLIKFSKKNKISFYGLMTYFTIASINIPDTVTSSLSISPTGTIFSASTITYSAAAGITALKFFEEPFIKQFPDSSTTAA